MLSLGILSLEQLVQTPTLPGYGCGWPKRARIGLQGTLILGRFFAEIEV